MEGSHFGHQISKYARSLRIGDRPPVVQHYGSRRGHSGEGKGGGNHVRRWLGDMDGDLHQTFPHNQPECEAQHEAFPGSCGQFYEGKWIRPFFPENCVRPIPQQHLRTQRCTSKWTGRASLHRITKYLGTQHSLGAHEPVGCAQRAERLPSPQHNQGAICSALGEQLQEPRERGAGSGALTPVVRTGGYAPPLGSGPSPSHRHRGARCATGPRAAAIRAVEDGAAGDAFVIPEFNNPTHPYWLPAV